MKGIISFLLFLIVFFSKGQDVHYSMFSFASASLNPALTGIMEHDHSESDFRFFTNYRNQWRSIRSPYGGSQPTPFATYSVSSDMRLRWLRVLRYNAIGIGGMVYRDQSGDLNFGTTQLAWSISFQKSIGRARRDFFTMGFQSATVRRSLDFSNSTFDNQWTGTSYDPGASTGEKFPAQQFYYQDMNTGISYVHRPLKKGTPWMLGLAYFHLNNGNQSFYNGIYEVLLKRKFVLHGSAKINVQDNYILYPVFLFAKQGQATETNLTVYAGRKPVTSDLQARLGVGYRLVSSLQNDVRSDALLMALWFLYKQWDFGFSYDANFSGLKRATQVRGGLEVFLIYHHRFDRPKSKYHHFKNRMPECPNIDRE